MEEVEAGAAAEREMDGEHLQITDQTGQGNTGNRHNHRWGMADNTTVLMAVGWVLHMSVDKSVNGIDTAE